MIELTLGKGWGGGSIDIHIPSIVYVEETQQGCKIGLKGGTCKFVQESAETVRRKIQGV